MLNIIFAGILFLSTFFCFSQNEVSVRYFGQNAGIKFQSDGSVIPLSDGKLITNEGCASIANSYGDLLFYTDGRTVWDKNYSKNCCAANNIATNCWACKSGKW